MKKLLLLLLFIPLVSYGQTFKEIQEFHDNGNKYIEVVKNSDLTIIQRNKYSESGALISKFNIDPKSGLLDGDFIYNELSKNEEILNTSKGYLNKGLLNCEKCTIKVDISNVSSTWVFTDFLNPKNDGIKFQGKFIDGKPVGKIRVYEYIEETTTAGVDVLGTNINARLGIADVKYFYKATGNMIKIPIGELNYNKDGYLDGEQTTSTESYPAGWKNDSNNFKKLIYKDGILNELYVLEKANKNIFKDSIIRNSQIWKLDGKYVRNNGQLNFEFNEFTEAFYFQYGNFYKANSRKKLKPLKIFKGIVYSDDLPRTETSKANNIFGSISIPNSNFNFVGDQSILNFNIPSGKESSHISTSSLQPVFIMGGYSNSLRNGLRKKITNVRLASEYADKRSPLIEYALMNLYLPINLTKENIFFNDYLIGTLKYKWRYYGSGTTFSKQVADQTEYDIYYGRSPSFNDVSGLAEILKYINSVYKEQLELNNDIETSLKTLSKLPNKIYSNDNFFYKNYINIMNDIIDNRKLAILDVKYYNIFDQSFITYKDFHQNELNAYDKEFIERKKNEENEKQLALENKILEFKNLLKFVNKPNVFINYKYENRYGENKGRNNFNANFKDYIDYIIESRNLSELKRRISKSPPYTSDKDVKFRKPPAIREIIDDFSPNSIIKGLDGIKKIIDSYGIKPASYISDQHPTEISTNAYIITVPRIKSVHLSSTSTPSSDKSASFLISKTELKSIDFYYNDMGANNSKKNRLYDKDDNPKGFSISTYVYLTKPKIKNSLFSIDSKILKKYIKMPGFVFFELYYDLNEDKFYLNAIGIDVNKNLSKIGTVGEVILP